MDTTQITNLRIRGREFTVSAVAVDGDTKYVLTGPRGAKYATMRRRDRASLMFLVHCGERGFGIPSGFESCWLTDADGTLALAVSR